MPTLTKIRTATGAAIAAALCTLAAGCGPDPVTDEATLVSYYDGHPVVKAYVHTFGDRINLKAGLLGNYSDPEPDGNGVHVHLAGFYYNDASGYSPWSSDWTTPTIGTASGEKPIADVHSIFNAPGFVKYDVNACAQMGFPISDSCTARTVKSAF